MLRKMEFRMAARLSIQNRQTLALKRMLGGTSNVNCDDEQVRNWRKF